MELNRDSPFDSILFDLDDTLYSSALGIGQACRQNIEEFLAAKCGVSAEKAASLCADFFRTYGSSFTGLLANGYDVHPDEYHSYVHGRLPYENIKPDIELQLLLQSISTTKIIFTNSDQKHAKKVLERLGIEERCFQHTICFETLNPHLFVAGGKKSAADQVILKPSISAMETAIRLSGCNPYRTLFLDDSERNIKSGKAMGLKTALVGKTVKINEADYYLVEGIGNLRRIIPEIWTLTDMKQEDLTVLRNDDLDSINPQATTVIMA